MDAPGRTAVEGCVASLHLHLTQPGNPMPAVASLEVVAAKGILDNP
ncbi:MAG: hypothetical protein ACYDH9_27305 [Limisphaerales bacterium]